MSTSLDYQRKAYRYSDKFNDVCFVVLCEAGCSNVFELNGRRARKWYVLADGPQYFVYAEIVRYAAHAIGGMLKLNKMGKWHSDFTDALQVIRVYKKVFDCALPIEQADPVEREMIRIYRDKKAVAA